MKDHIIKMTNAPNHFDVYVESVNQRPATGTDIWESGRMNPDLPHEAISQKEALVRDYSKRKMSHISRPLRAYYLKGENSHILCRRS